MEEAPRFQADRKRRGVFFLTERDREMVRWVSLVGMSTREQLQRLFFGPGSRSRCQHRLTLLYRNRYLDRMAGRLVNMPDVYCLSRRSYNGTRLLRADGSNEPVRLPHLSMANLHHTLDVVSSRVQITRACVDGPLALCRWLGEDDLQELMLRSGIRPDAYFQLARSTPEGEKRSAFFLEVERSDKSERALRDKFRRYGLFYYGGRFEQLFGGRALRILVLVAASHGIRPERRIERLVWLAEQADVTVVRFAPLAVFLGTLPQDVLTAEIWRRPSQPGLSALF
jgi:hypothetical protein